MLTIILGDKQNLEDHHIEAHDDKIACRSKTKVTSQKEESKKNIILDNMQKMSFLQLKM